MHGCPGIRGEGAVESHPVVSGLSVPEVIMIRQFLLMSDGSRAMAERRTDYEVRWQAPAKMDREGRVGDVSLESPQGL